MLAVKLARSSLVPGLLPPSRLLLISRSEEEREILIIGSAVVGVTKRLKGRRGIG